MRVIAIYPGRFHPFHKGHASSFKQLATKFGISNTYLALSEKQELPKSPFSAGDRANMAIALGIPKEHIISVKNPYGAAEYVKRFETAGIDPETTVLVFGVSKKDMEGVPELGIPPDPRFTFAPKKDGSPSYLQPFAGTAEKQPMTKHAYVISTDVAEFPIAGQTMRDASAIRTAYLKADDEMRNRILTDLYGTAAKHIKPIFDQNLNLTEHLKALISAASILLKESIALDKRQRLFNVLKEARNHFKQHLKEGKQVRKSVDYLEEK